jgi:hypothetical protein
MLSILAARQRSLASSASPNITVRSAPVPDSYLQADSGASSLLYHSWPSSDSQTSSAGANSASRSSVPNCSLSSFRQFFVAHPNSSCIDFFRLQIDDRFSSSFSTLSTPVQSIGSLNQNFSHMSLQPTTFQQRTLTPYPESTSVVHQVASITRQVSLSNSAPRSTSGSLNNRSTRLAAAALLEATTAESSSQNNNKIRASPNRPSVQISVSKQSNNRAKLDSEDFETNAKLNSEVC